MFDNQGANIGWRRQSGKHLAMYWCFKVADFGEGQVPALTEAMSIRLG
jgi:hypothetical protein